MLHFASVSTPCCTYWRVVGSCRAKFENGQTFNYREIKIHVYPKRQTWLCTTWPSFSPYFPFTVYCFYTKISSFMPALSIRIALDCFYLLIFYSEKFSTDVCRLPYAVNVNLNLSYITQTDASSVNIIGPTMLGVVGSVRSVISLLGVLASVCRQLPTRTQQVPTLSGQQCW